MALSEDDQDRQTRIFGELLTAARPLADDDDAAWRRRAYIAEAGQGVLCLSLGVEVGFFGTLLAAEYLHRLRERVASLGGDVRGALPVFAGERVIQLLKEGLVVPAYRPAFAATDETAVALRAAVLPIARLRDGAGGARDTLAKVVFDQSWPNVRSPRAPITPDDANSAIEVLQYLEMATLALKPSAWESREQAVSTDSSLSAWLVAEIGMLYQVQIDTSDREVKRRLLAFADTFVRATEEEASRIIQAGATETMEQTEALAQLSVRADAWRAEAIRIVDDFDAALAVPAVA